MIERLIVFTRYPEPGKSKTRLIPALGAEGAADLQRRMTERTLRIATDLASRRGVEIELRFEGGSERLMGEWLSGDTRLGAQGGGDLGEKMARAFADAFLSGAGHVAIVGTDCPGISDAILDAAFAALERVDLVLGPANDGGYYLIGLRRLIPELFNGIAWGTNEVREATLRIAESLGLSISLLEPLDDVDRPEDLPVWERVDPTGPCGST